MKKERKRKTLNQIGWAIFSDDAYTWRRRPWEVFHYIKLYFKRLKYLKKYGCSETAFWETSYWFQLVMKEILTHYRYKRFGTPIIIDDWNIDNEKESNERNEKAYDDYLDKMLDLLNKMDEDYYWDGNNWDKDKDKKMEEAKDEFMKMFSEIFYALWD